jgi:hypothetical protein
MNDFYVYGHYTLDTNELFYIGKGRGNRFIHNQKGKRSAYWFKITKKHGFRAEILIDNLSESDALIQEILGIKEFKPRANFTSGGIGCSGYKRSESDRKAISERMKGFKNHRYGKIGTMKDKKMPKEGLDKLKFKVYDLRKNKSFEEIYGLEKSIEIKDKMKGHPVWNSGMKMSDTHREKLSKAHGCRTIFVYCKLTKNLIGKWENMTKCSKDLIIKQSVISRYLNGRNQYSKYNKHPYFFTYNEVKNESI